MHAAQPPRRRVPMEEQEIPLSTRILYSIAITLDTVKPVLQYGWIPFITFLSASTIYCGPSITERLQERMTDAPAQP